MASTTPTTKDPYFSYLVLNMKYTVWAWEGGRSTRVWVQIAHRIAQATVVPFLLLAACEGVGKNGLFLILNLGIFLANQIVPQKVFAHLKGWYARLRH